MIRTIIIDDEQHCIDRLTDLIRNNCKESIEIAGAFQSVSTGLAAIKNIRPELVFLDVQIDSQTGFDLLKQVPEISFDIIFTTAYEKYAVQAFKFSAIDYLLKPVDPDDLLQAVEKLKEKISKDETAKKVDVLIHNMKNLQGNTKKISIPTLTGLVFLQIKDIIRCQSDVNYTTIYLQDKTKLLVAKTLKEFEELLTEYNFFRIHNSHLVNLEYIKSYNKGKGGFVTIADGSEIEVSTRRKDLFLKKLSEL